MPEEASSEGNSVLTRLYTKATDTLNATSVSMLAEPWRACRTALIKKRRPKYRMGKVSTSITQAA